MFNDSNIASHLSRIADEYPDHLAIVIANSNGIAQQCTYRQLDEASDTLARGLQKAGIEKGTRTVLMVLPSLEFFTLVFALFKMGAVLVGVDPGMGVKNLGKCLAEAEPEAFIGNRKAHLARNLLRWGSKTIHIKITTENLPLKGSTTLDLKHVQELGAEDGAGFDVHTSADDMAAILFTSGSTGIPKGVIYTHSNFNAQVRALQTTFDIKPGEIDLATFPLFALFAPAMGMTSVIPEMDFTRPGEVDPEKIIYAIDKYGTTTMFGSPALLNRVGRWGVEHNIKLPTLKRVLSAGAPVTPVILERFGKLLEAGVQIHTPYGATESLPVSSIGSDEILKETRSLTEQGKGICVGLPVESVDIKIIRIIDEPIPEWQDDLVSHTYETGEIVVQGPQVTGSYYNRPESTAIAKIQCDDGGFYHRMGDLGYLDEQGRLWFCGRKSQRIKTADRVLYTIPCEAVFNIHERVFRTALTGILRNGETTPVLCVELEPDHKKADRDKIKGELLQIGSQYEHTRMIQEILFHPGFPVDIRHNAKISREKLSVWANKQLA